ncbi:hypothetical protein FDA94_28855 [Herbidospora galbida]|uniref:Uncharacterized protein n=1 Tax=Herbidospora galbida TaxID=2575442 RepID=A0A4U3M8K2_9ACTN|nr:hypothetical protein [Herbidospora galbida]TKK84642.1 hypothetical protein FDA94_28855 [Herbidospora galbida]
MTDLYYSGTELNAWRTLLTDQGVRHQALSYLGLARRVTFKKPWLVADKYSAETMVLLDSGGYTIRKNPDAYTEQQVLDLAIGYTDFVTKNVGDLQIVVDFDVPSVPQTSANLRQIAGDRFMPVWHPEDGLDKLYELAEQHQRVGVTATVVNGQDITHRLRTLAAHTQLHGLAMTKPTTIAALPWSSISSTSWLSPSQYGDTIVWAAGELKRYPRKYKDQARTRHRALFLDLGLDPELINADDTTEVLKLSIWSWTQYMNSINGVSNTPPKSPQRANTENASESFDTTAPEHGNVVALKRREKTRLLPGIGVETREISTFDEDGNKTFQPLPLISNRAESQRQCDTCFLREKCPEYEPDSTCAFDLPVSARTKEQLTRIQDVLIEIQTQRVLYGRFTEEVAGGGYPDPNVSAEIDRLQRMLKARSTFKITIEGDMPSATAEAGYFSRMFGEKAAAATRAIEPVRDEDVAAQLGIVDGEVVGEDIKYAA